MQDDITQACKHVQLNVDAQIQAQPSHNAGLLFLDIRVKCEDCGEAFVFTMANPPAPTLRLAIAPASLVAAAQRRILIPTITGGVDGISGN